MGKLGEASIVSLRFLFCIELYIVVPKYVYYNYFILIEGEFIDGIHINMSINLILSFITLVGS